MGGDQDERGRELGNDDTRPNFPGGAIREYRDDLLNLGTRVHRVKGFELPFAKEKRFNSRIGSCYLMKL